MAKDIVTWLNDELNRRGWSNSELHRRSGMANSTISMVLGGQKKPGWDFCAAIARALGEPPEKIFRLAGLLPPLPASDDTLLQELLELAGNLSPQSREELLTYARFRYQHEQNEKQGKR